MTDFRAAVQAVLPGVRRDLEDLIKIQSVSADPERFSEVQRSAEKVAELFTAEGFECQIVKQGGQPAVIGEKAGPAGAPTVLLYAHHDVQPENDPADWDSPPWEPTERGERLYARGAADDKAGIATHLAAARIFGDDLPVTLKLFIEGEEEVGSVSLPDLLATYKEQLRSDVIVIADSGNWDIGVPALTTSLRGLVRMDVEVRTLDHAVHSGMWGRPRARRADDVGAPDQFAARRPRKRRHRRFAQWTRGRRRISRRPPAGRIWRSIRHRMDRHRLSS